MKSEHIYINPQGVQCAPIGEYECPKCGYTMEDAMIQGDHRLCGLPMPSEEYKQSAIPIREEDRKWASAQIVVNTPVSKTEIGFTVDTFYPVEPYEFEMEETEGWYDSTRKCHIYPKTVARIIRPSEPKADPKEKEFHDFDVIAKMVTNGGKGIKLAPEIVTAQGTKKGAKITMGVDLETGQDIMRSMHLNDDTLRVFLMIVDMAEFEKVKSSM